MPLVYMKNEIASALCPACQGSGVNVEGDGLEKPSIKLFEIRKYQEKVAYGYRFWMKSPEVLQNCSTGFHFPDEFDEAVQGLVKPLKMLRFYRAVLPTSEEERDAEDVHIQKMEEERLENAKLKAENEKAEKEKADKKAEEANS